MLKSGFYFKTILSNNYYLVCRIESKVRSLKSIMSNPFNSGFGYLPTNSGYYPSPYQPYTNSSFSGYRSPGQRPNQQNNYHNQRKRQNDFKDGYDYGSKRKRQSLEQDPDKFSRPEIKDKQSEYMYQYFRSRQQTQAVYDKKLKLRTALYAIVKNTFPFCGLYIVGSSMNGFGSSNSDMDLCLMMSHKQIHQKKEACEILRVLQQAFRKTNFLRQLQVIPAKVPILRFRDTTNDIEVDLNINNSIGIRNTHLLGTYARLDWRVRPLVLYIKKWAMFHDINSAMKMTFSSYSLTLMIIHYLQDGVKPPVLPCLQTLCPTRFKSDSDIRFLSLTDGLPEFTSQNNQSLFDLFEGFIRYYAYDFNYEKYAISVRLGSKLNRDLVIGNTDPKQWKFICIEEPFELNNVSRSVYDPSNYQKIRRVFSTSASVLKRKGKIDSLFDRPF